jgi:hypothetical protein
LLLDKANVKYTNAVFYRTVASDLSDLKDMKYDMLVFFSPGGIESLKKNFPKFKQNGVVIAAFGPTTAKAVRDNGYRLDIEAPLARGPEHDRCHRAVHQARRPRRSDHCCVTRPTFRGTSHHRPPRTHVMRLPSQT